MKDNDEILILLGFILLLFSMNEKDNGTGDNNNIIPDCSGQKSFLDKTGEPPAVRNNNPGNLVRGSKPFNGEIKSTGDFRRFGCWKYGVRAMIKNLQGPLYFGKGYRSVEDIIKVWAPLGKGKLGNSFTVQNNYINFIAGRLKVSRTAKLTASKHNLRLLVKNMSEHEAGKPIVTDEDFENAWAIL